MLMDNKAVVNDHFIHETGWQLNYVSKRHRRSHQVWFLNWGTIPIEYNATKYKLYVKYCTPTKKELAMVPIQWIDCYIKDLDIDNGKKPVHRKSNEYMPQITDPNKE
eukprot:12992261-Ditylum_brightwellii.AAC.1